MKKITTAVTAAGIAASGLGLAPALVVGAVATGAQANAAEGAQSTNSLTVGKPLVVLTLRQPSRRSEPGKYTNVYGEITNAYVDVTRRYFLPHHLNPSRRYPRFTHPR